MPEKIRWGILGCGKIAHKFANDLKLVENGILMGVASRDKDNCEAFARQYGAANTFTDYESLASSKDIDAIYIATPHGLHHDHTLLCLRHRKAVLCEKAFALNARHAKEMIDFARKEKVFLMEAFWTKFLPQYNKVMEIIHSGQIGDIKWLQADFGFKAPDPPAQRIFDPALGGGSLLDVGIYPVFLALSLFKTKPEQITATITPHATGVDEQCAMSLTFSNGVIASLSSSFMADTPVEAVIAGTKGRILWRNRWHNAIGEIELVLDKDEPVKIDVHRESGYGYQFEARHVGECLQKGLTESPVMSHADTMLLMETLDAIRGICGIRYPVDV
ncbi:MAG TPA: Gfo/Idh/MocA family oxidoreductase [Ohtaekwangia sp.]